MKRISSILLICLILLSTMPASVAASIVTPETITDTLTAGDTEHDTITVTLPSAASTPIKELTVKARYPSYASWVTSVPTAYYGVPWGEIRSFDVDITPPAETMTGTYRLYLDVYGDDVLLGTTTVTKGIEGTIPSPEFPTLALPMVMILGFVIIVHFFRSRKEE